MVSHWTERITQNEKRERSTKSNSTKTKKMETESRMEMKKWKSERNKRGQNAYRKSRTHYLHILSHRNRKRRSCWLVSPACISTAIYECTGVRPKIFEYIIKWNLLIVWRLHFLPIRLEWSMVGVWYFSSFIRISSIHSI